ncbi:MAG: hypothetical protein H0V71_12235 [Chloroflexi bacterium]|nr:hypothetical protein [Chloroflexota bacterium]
MGSERALHPGREDVVVGYVSDLYELLHAIDETMPTNSILYLEGTSIVQEVKDFLSAHQAAESREVEPNTRWPRPHTFHLPLEGTNLTELRQIADRYAEPEICDHLVVYRGDAVLLWAHDAGYGYVSVSRSLPDEITTPFQDVLGAALRRSN